MQVFGGREEASQRGFDAQALKVVTGDEESPSPMRAAVIIERDLDGAIAEQRFKDGVAIANVAIVGKGIRGLAPVVNEEDPVRVRNWQRLQQECVEDTEDDGVRADAKGQRQNRRRREAGRLPQYAERINQ